MSVVPCWLSTPIITLSSLDWKDMKKAQKYIRKIRNRSHNVTPTQSGSPGHQDSGTIVLDTIDSLLKVVREVSVPFAPLQAAVGGICECINIYKV